MKFVKHSIKSYAYLMYENLHYTLFQGWYEYINIANVKPSTS